MSPLRRNFSNKKGGVGERTGILFLVCGLYFHGGLVLWGVAGMVTTVLGIWNCQEFGRTLVSLRAVLTRLQHVPLLAEPSLQLDVIALFQAFSSLEEARLHDGGEGVCCGHARFSGCCAEETSDSHGWVFDEMTGRGLCNIRTVNRSLTEAWEMARLVKCLPYKRECWNSHLQHPLKR